MDNLLSSCLIIFLLLVLFHWLESLVLSWKDILTKGTLMVGHDSIVLRLLWTKQSPAAEAGDIRRANAHALSHS